MGKSLVIAEKPSVAADLARALGKFEKTGDYFENEKYVISSAIGHLVELCLPGEFDKQRGKWSFANLPIIPDEFALKPIEKTEPRFNLLKRLMKRKDVTEVINACDAGREGELIFRYLVKLSGMTKPTRRLWLQSMTLDAIRTAFERLRPDAEMIPLGEAAVSRSESDWLVGINSTRALTAFNSKTGGFQLTPVGRVQTPTLAILAEREEKIRAFKSRTYFEVFGDFEVQAGAYRGRWFDEAFRKGAEEDTRAERIWDRARAEEIKARCEGKQAEIVEEKKPASQAPPLLYDLTSLQREANGRHGFSARRTLQIAQQLYEKHKVLTYPRTDSRFLPEDNLSQARTVMGSFIDPSLSVHAGKALGSGWVRLSKRIFDNSKVTDHNAIIPTGHPPAVLDEDQRRIFDMVARRFIAVFYPSAQFEVTTRITRVEKEAFKTEGKIILDPGWLAVYGREASGGTEAEKVTVAIVRGEPAHTRAIEIKQNETKPPPRFNEATLLSAMEGAGKLIDDEELREAMSAKGLGTPATRAAIIEGLIKDGYIDREGRELIATAKGLSLITLLRGLGANALCSPEMTGEWEFKLKQMEHGVLQRAAFMNEIRALTGEIVTKVKGFKGDSVDGNYAVLDIKCPKCGAGPIAEDYRTFRCQACDFLIWKTMAGRQFELEEVTALLTTGKVGPLEGFRSKRGFPFAAIVKLGEDLKPVFEFESNGSAAEEHIDLAGAEKMGLCRVCEKGQVYDLPNAYTCENAIAAAKTCTFRLNKTILQKQIPKEQAAKLLETGKTDLIPGFISKKGRPFAAYLKLEAGKIVFEFEPRKEKSKRPKGVS